MAPLKLNPDVLAERIGQLDRRIDERFIASEKVSDEKWRALGIKLEGMNEFREQLNRQAWNLRNLVDAARHDAHRLNAYGRDRPDRRKYS